MPIFNLTDITFKAPTSGSGPLASLAGSKYDLNTYKYPIDLGSTDKAHYMVININEQGKTQFAGTPSGDLPTVIQNYRNTGVSAQGLGLVNNVFGAAQAVGGSAADVAAQAKASKVGVALAGPLNTAAQAAGAVGNALSNAFPGISNYVGGVNEGLNAEFSSGANNILNGFTRTIRRITDTVCLYMPDTLAFTYEQNYDTPSIAKGLAGVAAVGASAVDSVMKTNAADAGKAAGQNLSPFIVAGATAGAGSTGKILFAAATGLAQNPMLELIYSSPAFRSFQFDFMMYPRSEKEALEIQNIIDRLRFHQAPEVLKSGMGFFLVPPSEFDIRFMYNGKENPNIPKISTCVLKNIFTDYGQGGASFYEVPGESATKGRTGMPVGIRLTLSFQETEIMTKTSYNSAASEIFQDTGAGTTTNSFGQAINNNFALGT